METILFTKTVQPDTGELISQFVSILCISIMSSLCGIKTYRARYKYLSYTRWLVKALYLLSWAFTSSSMILTSTNNDNQISCFLSIMTCDLFYSGTKLTIYCWLIEKVWAISTAHQTRWNTLSYKIHCLLLTPYIAIFSLMVSYHRSDITETGECIIGFGAIASVPLLVYDFLFNLYMTILFVKKLTKTDKDIVISQKVSRLQEVAQRTLFASVVCLFVSFANIMALIALDGRERGVICLTCCTVDVTINVITIHWVTSNRTTRKSRENRRTILSHPNYMHDHPNPHYFIEGGQHITDTDSMQVAGKPRDYYNKSKEHLSVHSPHPAAPFKSSIETDDFHGIIDTRALTVGVKEQDMADSRHSFVSESNNRKFMTDSA